MLYDKKGSIKESKDEIIKRNLSLVKRIAQSINKKINYLADIEDLIQTGVLGLLDAIDKFKDNQEAQFETYASTRIYGAIMDELRKNDPLSQADRVQIKEIESIKNTINKNNKYSDTIIAQKCNISLTKYYHLEQLNAISNVLYANESNDVMDLICQIESSEDNPQELIEKKELKEKLILAINELVEREKILMGLYYQEELSLKEIASILDLTEARVSQLHTGIIKKLKFKLNN